MFVELEQYKKDVGEPTPQDITIEEIDGVEVKGVCMLAPGEKIGYHHIEDYTDRNIKQQGTVNDGTVELAEGDVQHQWKQMEKGIEAQEPGFLFNNCE